MAWARKTHNDLGGQQETVTQASSATYAYTSYINFLKPKTDGKNRYVTLWCTASAVSGTNIDISLWGSLTSGGTKFLLTDAPGSISDLTNSAKTAAASFDLEAYPAPFYFIGMLADADESANTVQVNITPEIL